MINFSVRVDGKPKYSLLRVCAFIHVYLRIHCRKQNLGTPGLELG